MKIDKLGPPLFYEELFRGSEKGRCKLGRGSYTLINEMYDTLWILCVSQQWWKTVYRVLSAKITLLP